MGNLDKKFDTVEDFFWKSKKAYEPLDLIGHGLLGVFKHPDSVYIKDLRVIEDRRGNVMIFMVVHNASEYNFQDHVIESYYFNYNKDDVTSWLECQYDDEKDLWARDRRDLEELVEYSHLMKSYREQFKSSKHQIEGYAR